jgi:PPP family 3-phenylpropionic acid transporter
MLFFNLSAFYFSYFAAVGVYIIFLPKVLIDIGYSAYDIGIILALAPLMRFATPFLFLKHIKLTQNLFRSILIVAILSSSSFYITIDNFYTFMINNAVLGICLSILLPYIETISLQTIGSQRYGKVRLFGSIGFMLIALVLAKFLTVPKIALHYYLFATILTVFFSFRLLKYDQTDHNLPIKNEKQFSILKYWPFWLSLFLMQISFGGFYNFFTIYETSKGISLETTSYLWSFGVICEILMLYFQASFLKYNLLSIIKISIFLTIIRWLLLFLFPTVLYITYFTQSIHAFSFGLYHSAVIIYLYNLYDNKQLAQQFMFGIAYGLGGFLGSLIAGAVYGDYLFLVSAMITTLSLLSLLLHNDQQLKQ